MSDLPPLFNDDGVDPKWKEELRAASIDLMLEPFREKVDALWREAAAGIPAEDFQAFVNENFPAKTERLGEGDDRA